MTTPNVLYFSPEDRDTPDVSLNLSHLRALLNAALDQLTPREITATQHNTAAWLVSDSLRALQEMEDKLYPTATP